MEFPVDLIKEPEGISLLFLALFTFIQLFYYWYYFARMAFGEVNSTEGETNEQSVSVIVCARNEYENLKNNLPSILEQDYPDFEVVVVNDFSQDDSYYLLKSYEEKYPHFKVVHLRENVNFFEGKKLALAVGIKSAKNDLILLTDADCWPMSKNWIKSMSSKFSDKKSLVLGYGGYDAKPGFLNKLIRYDTISVAMQYFGFAKAGSPYMGVGRNLAYRKSLFFKTGGFAAHYKIKSGDDDLFVNKAANKENTAICIHPDSFTFSAPKPDFHSWFKQKKRHLSTGVYYKLSDKLKLGLFALSGSFFYISLIAFFILAQSMLTLAIAIGLIVLRTFSLVLLHKYAGKRLLEKKLFLYSPIFDVIFVFLNPVFAIANLFYRKNKWK